MSLYNLWWYDCPSNQFQHSLSLQLQGLNSHLIWIDFFGNLSSWLQVPLHTNTESRPFSSPFTSFCEIITFLTPGFFSWGQIALIQSTFPCSSVLLDLPVCSPLLFPVVSCFLQVQCPNMTQCSGFNITNVEGRGRTTLYVLQGQRHRQQERKDFPFAAGHMWTHAHSGVTGACINTRLA